MANRGLKRTIVGALLLALTLVLGLLAWRVALPAFLERRITTTLSEHGLREPRLQIDSVGLRGAEASGLRTAGDSWTLELEQATVSYRPLELWRSRIRTIELDGLRYEFGLPLARSAEPGISPEQAPTTAVLEAIPWPVPFRSLSISNSSLVLNAHGHTRILPFTTHMTSSDNGSALQGLVEIHDGANRGRLEMRLAQAEESWVTATVEVADPAAYLALIQAHSAVGSLGAIAVEPWSGMLTLRMDADGAAGDVILQGDPARMGWAGGRLKTSALTGRASLHGANMNEMRLDTDLELNLDSGWVIEAPGLVLELMDQKRLKASGRGARASVAEAVKAEGDFLLTMEDVTAGRLGVGSLDFNLRQLNLPGVEAMSAAGKVWGGMEAIQFDVAWSVAELHGVRATDVSVTGSIHGHTGELRGAPLPEFMRGLVGRFPAWMVGAWTNAEVNLELLGREIELPDGGIWTAPSLRVRRPGAGEPGSEVYATVAAGSERLDWNGLAWSGLRCLGTIEGEHLWLAIGVDKLDWPERRLTVDNLRADVRLTSVEPVRSMRVEQIQADRVTFDTYELRGPVAKVQLLPNGDARLEILEGRLLGGQVRSSAFLWNWQTGSGTIPLQIEGLDLNELAGHIPRLPGSLEGRIGGSIALVRENGVWRIRGGHLALDRRFPARFRYLDQGLLTGELDPDSPRYAQLRMVEEGLRDLVLSEVRVEVFDPAVERTPLRVRLEGTSTSAQAVVPIILNFNVTGDVDELFQLIESGKVEFDF